MKSFLLFILSSISVYLVSAQNSFFFTTKQCRDSVTEQLQQDIHNTCKLPLNDNTYQKWMSAFWAMELMVYKPIAYEKLIAQHITKLPQTGPGFQRAFLELLYALYMYEFDEEIKAIVPKLKSDKVKAMALEYINASGNSYWIDTSDSFKRSLYFELYEYNRKKSEYKQPSLNDFLHPTFLPRQAVLCSFQSTDRNKPGYLMIRLQDGTWMKNEQGEPLKFPQLARSISNLPFYLTNGNTPQGLYKITGIDTSDNNWIGPTANLQMIMPFENKASDFFGDDTSYNKHYLNLLGTYLQQFAGLKESYWAGKIGRTEIIAHGTTINPEYYKQQRYYPNTPSLGCLCSPELWNEKGERTYSAQSQWMHYIISRQLQCAYLIVAEVIDL